MKLAFLALIPLIAAAPAAPAEPRGYKSSLGNLLTAGQHKGPDGGSNVNINGINVGATPGISGAKFVGSNYQGVQLYQFDDGSVAPLTVGQGDTVNSSVTVGSNGVCSICTNGQGWAPSGNTAGKRDGELSTSLDARDTTIQSRTLGLLWGLFGSAFNWGGAGVNYGCGVYVGPSRVPGYVCNGGYINVYNVAIGTGCGINGGYYVGCNSYGTQLWRWNDGSIGPLCFNQGYNVPGVSVGGDGLCSSCWGGWGGWNSWRK